jgi:hypothetical protein
LSLRTDAMNDLCQYGDLFAAIPRATAPAPSGYAVDFLGNLIATEWMTAMRRVLGAGSHSATDGDVDRSQLEQPSLGGGRNGEYWFEAVDWFVAAREARDCFVMASLGAFFGYQAVGARRALDLVNPMPSRLVCVEPVPAKMALVRRHFRDNGIDPDAQWLIETAIGATNDPVLFPVGAPEVAGHNCIATNEPGVRQDLLRTIMAHGRGEQALADLILRNSTGMTKDPGGSAAAEIKFVSCVTLADVLGPFDFVDYVEADLQQSEIVVFPPFVDLLRRKVRRLHIGTHGGEAHAMLRRLFGERGWQAVFDYPPDGRHASPFGEFTTNDGILTFRNPDL